MAKKGLRNSQIKEGVGINSIINAAHEGGVKRPLEDLVAENEEKDYVKPREKPKEEAPMLNPNFGKSVDKKG